MKARPSFFLLLVVMTSCQATKAAELKPIEFFPRKFHDVRLGLYETSDTACTPRKAIAGSMNRLAINLPEKIVFRPGLAVRPVVPLCGAYMVSLRRGLKYSGQSSAMTLHVRRVGEERWYSGALVDPNLKYEHPALPPNHEEESREMERIKEAQAYKDEELDEGQASGGFINVDVLEFVEVQLQPGRYEVYLSMSGLESNHATVEVVFQK